MDFSSILHDNSDETNNMNSLIDCFFSQNDNLTNESAITDISLVNEFPQLTLNNTNPELNFTDKSLNYSLHDIASEYLSNFKETSYLTIEIDKIKTTSTNQSISNINEFSNTNVSEKELINQKVLIVPNLSKYNKRNNKYLKKETKISSLLFKKLQVTVEKISLTNDFDINEQTKWVMMMKTQRK